MEEITGEQLLQKADEQAALIGFLNQFAFQLDDEYLKTAAKITLQQAERYDSTAVLNRNWNPEKSQLLRYQAQAMKSLSEYIEASKKITEQKNKVAAHDKSASALADIFG